MPVKTDPEENTKVGSTVARSDDGTVQITFTIPYVNIKKEKADVVKQLSEGLEIPGFRKGMAPLTEAEKHIGQNTIIEKLLSKMLPPLLEKTFSENNLKPIIFPKVELVKAKENENWEIRATTAEILEFDIGDYKQIAKAANNKNAIWTPETLGNEKPGEENKPPTREQKEQNVIKALLEHIKVKIPKIILDEEVNARLAKLLERLEKLGLTLEGYLASINKTGTDLRNEYESQSFAAISLELILNNIARNEKIEISEEELQASLGAASADPKLAEELSSPDKKSLLEAVLKRRKALGLLVALS